MNNSAKVNEIALEQLHPPSLSGCKRGAVTQTSWTVPHCMIAEQLLVQQKASGRQVLASSTASFLLQLLHVCVAALLRKWCLGQLLPKTLLVFCLNLKSVSVLTPQRFPLSGNFSDPLRITSRRVARAPQLLLQEDIPATQLSDFLGLRSM